MSEVTKLYENAGIEPICRFKGLVNGTCFYFAKPCQEEDCKKFSAFVKEFTAEKQIELIKLLMEQDDFSWTIARQGKNTEYAFYVGYEHSSGDFKEFTETLAGIINNLWQDLTEEEKQQVKGILG